MNKQLQSIKPQDIVLLLKVISNNDDSWNQKPIAKELGMSQSGVSESVARSKFAGLFDASGKKVFRRALMDLLQYGIRYVFPQRPGAMVRGIPTAHSAKPLNQIIQSEEDYVWPSAKGKVRGQSILPLYPSVVDAVEFDAKLHELLALVDALRVGKIREQELAIKELQMRIL
jgi:hypothetical protein